METARDAKRSALRNRLIDAAEARIASQGLRGLKARDITADAGCALGGLYNAVKDLDQLVILVNARTLARLGEALKEAGAQQISPADKMQALAGGYVNFAQNNTALWSAVFNHRLPNPEDVPEWYKKEHAVLIEQLIAPLAEMRPDLSGDALKIRAQTLFASVHGVVQLSMHGRFVGTPAELLKSEVRALVAAMTRGIHLAQTSEPIPT